MSKITEYKLESVNALDLAFFAVVLNIPVTAFLLVIKIYDAIFTYQNTPELFTPSYLKVSVLTLLSTLVLNYLGTFILGVIINLVLLFSGGIKIGTENDII